MKSRLALGVGVLALAALWYAAGGASAPAAQARVSAPVTHDNLAVYFVHGPDEVANAKVATLQEALDAGWAVVNETGDVNTLTVENRSGEYELFIQEGDIIKGGRQDRMIAGDMLLTPNSGVVPIAVHCVEHHRWQGRGQEAATHFQASTQYAVGKELKYANAAGRQGAVWENVTRQQDKLSANVGVKVNENESESSLQLALENRQLQEKVAAFEAALRAAGEQRRNVVGVVFVVNGEVTGAEVYGSNALFRKAWPKLLRSAAAEAVAEKPKDGATPSAPTAKEVERFLALAGQGQPTGRNAGVLLISDGTSNVLINDNIGPQVNLESPPDPDAPNAAAFRGVSGATRSRLNRGGGQTVNPTAPAQDSVIMGGSGTGAVDTQRLRRLTETWSGQGPQQRTQALAELLRDVPERHRPAVEEYFRQLDRQQRAQAPNAGDQERFQTEGVRGERFQTEGHRGQTEGQAPAVSPDGNRLSVNRVEGAAGLVTESRDPGRQNAVIHKSYIKK